MTAEAPRAQQDTQEGVEDHLPLPHLAFQVLVVLAGGPNHGYGIAKELEVISDGRTRPGTGSLYLSLANLREAGLARETEPPGGERVDARRKYYRLTALGRRVAAAESERLARLLELARRRHVAGAAAGDEAAGLAAEA